MELLIASSILVAAGIGLWLYLSSRKEKPKVLRWHYDESGEPEEFQARRDIEDAFAAWRAAGVTLEIKEARNKSDSNLLILWEEMPDGVAASYSPEGETQKIRLSTIASLPVKFRVEHEFGHAGGLDHDGDIDDLGLMEAVANAEMEPTRELAEAINDNIAKGGAPLCRYL